MLLQALKGSPDGTFQSLVAARNAGKVGNRNKSAFCVFRGSLKANLPMLVDCCWLFPHLFDVAPNGILPIVKLRAALLSVYMQGAGVSLCIVLNICGSSYETYF